MREVTTSKNRGRRRGLEYLAQGWMSLPVSARAVRCLLCLMLATFTAGCAPARSGLIADLADSPPHGWRESDGSRDLGTEGDRRETARILVEGHLTVSISDVETALGEVRRIASQLGGSIVKERMQPMRLISTVTIRVPPERVDELFDAISGLGSVRDRSIQRVDVTWHIQDADLQLENLRRSLTRYEELLHLASTVDEILAIEAELNRVRTEIDRIAGRRSLLADRVELATIDVRLQREEMPRTPEPRAWPGIRGSYLLVASEGEGQRSFVGPGFALHDERSFHLDIDLLTRIDDPASVNAGLVTIGGDMYSLLLGAGERRWLNPHMGWASGYAWIEGQSQFALMLTGGLEIFRSETVMVDSGVRWGLLAGRGGPSLVLQPTMSLHIAF